MKNYISAEQLLKTESFRDSLNADVWNLLGFTSKLKKYEQSEAAYERAFKLNPQHEELWNTWASSTSPLGKI